MSGFLRSATMAFLCIISFGCFAQRRAAKTDFILLDKQQLQQAYQSFKSGDSSVVGQVNYLLTEANAALNTGPFSVTFQKTKLAPSGNRHDYVSQAPYWWSDSTKLNGRPYIRKDGRRNPEIRLLHDDSQMGQMTGAVKKLALAYYFTHDEKYAAKANTILRTWFIELSTRMNPNLNYGQFIPGICDGRGIGIIETAGLTTLPDALVLLNGSKNLTTPTINGVKTWFAQYLNWLLTSKNGKEERAQINNHGTNYDLQVIDFAIFTDNRQLAVTYIKNTIIGRIDQQFTIDGMQPLELVRTKSWGYSTMNLWTWCKIAKVASHLDIDLWHKQNIDGKGLKVAISWLLPFATNDGSWRFEQIDKFDYGNMVQIVNEAQKHYADLPVQEFLKAHPKTSDLQFLN